MPKIVLQAGHINSQNNSIVSLRGNTGAPGEQELTKRITDRVASLLRLRGFDVKQTDACANDDKTITTKDWDLFLAIHGDADDPKNNGGTVGTADPKTDGAAKESGRIKEAIRAAYFKETAITDRNFTTTNILQYYVWKYLTAKTPCVLIELGQVQDPHDKVLLGNTDLIANALARGICNAFNVPFESNPAPVIDKDKEIADLKRKLDDTNNALNMTIKVNEEKLAELKANCQVELRNVLNTINRLSELLK